MPDKKKPLEFGRYEQGDYQIRNAEIEAMLAMLGRLLKEKMPEGWGFTLLMFDYGEKTNQPGRDALFYTSSADRGDMILAMKEFIKKQEH